MGTLLVCPIECTERILAVFCHIAVKKLFKDRLQDKTRSHFIVNDQTSFQGHTPTTI
jgi:hypothetical protein